jgi:arsenate reductase-like glutaredoxin family protein
MELYGLKTCDTCRKALAALRGAGHTVAFRDIREDPLDDETRDRFLAAFGDRLVNTRSATWRGLDAAERAEAPGTLLARHPALMKRPVVETEAGGLYLGWDAGARAALL